MNSCFGAGAYRIEEPFAMSGATQVTERWLSCLRKGAANALAELFEHVRPRLRQMLQLRIGS